MLHLGMSAGSRLRFAKIALLVFGLSVVLLVGCGGESKPMTADEINEARVSVPTLYITESGKEVVAPGNRRRVVVEPQSGELAFMAYTCTHPNCPGKSLAEGDRPYLFIWPDPFAYVENGEVKIRLIQTDEDLQKQAQYADMACPECSKTRDRKNETAEQTREYTGAVKPYVLPEAETRLAELEEEYQRYLERKAELKRQLEGG